MGIKREIGRGNQILLQSLACCRVCSSGILLIGLSVDTEDVAMERKMEEWIEREIVTVQPGSVCHGVTYQVHLIPTSFPKS